MSSASLMPLLESLPQSQGHRLAGVALLVHVALFHLMVTRRSSRAVAKPMNSSKVDTLKDVTSRDSPTGTDILMSGLLTPDKIRTSLPASIQTMRKEYSTTGVEDEEIVRDPIEFFNTWLEEAIKVKCIEPNAMCLATCKDNRPSSRYVLLKSIDFRGFVWCTNYGSRKGQEIADNPFASVTFWWGDLERSVRVEGGSIRHCYIPAFYYIGLYRDCLKDHPRRIRCLPRRQAPRKSNW
jgi:hypothetical protein